MYCAIETVKSDVGDVFYNIEGVAIEKGFINKKDYEDGKVIYRGFTFLSPGEGCIRVTPDWRLRLDWCYDTYRLVWVSKEKMSILTYCEGDISVVVCLSVEAYWEELKSCEKCYEEDGI